MTAKRIILAVVFLIVITMIGVGYYFQVKQSRVGQFRQHIFCEVLQKGMTPSDVREVISRYGQFIETNTTFNGLSVIGIYFTDPDMVNQIGDMSITLVFRDQQYINARIPVPLSDNYRPLCP